MTMFTTPYYCRNVGTTETEKKNIKHADKYLPLNVKQPIK